MLPWTSPALQLFLGLILDSATREEEPHSIVGSRCPPAPGRTEVSQHSMHFFHTSIHKSMKELQNSNCSGKSPSNPLPLQSPLHHRSQPCYPQGHPILNSQVISLTRLISTCSSNLIHPLLFPTTEDFPLQPLKCMVGHQLNLLYPQCLAWSFLSTCSN